MLRKLRIEYPGAIYHVMSDGDRREDIFVDDVDRQDFLGQGGFGTAAPHRNDNELVLSIDKLVRRQIQGTMLIWWVSA